MAVRDEIEALSKSFAESVNEGDASGIAASWAEDGMLLPNGASRQAGREEIASFWQNLIDQGLSDFQVETVEVEDFGDVAFQVIAIKATMMQRGIATPVSGKALAIHKRALDGAWRVYRVADNMDE
jgi:uncharacterized protein (TIGR02246 family)